MSGLDFHQQLQKAGTTGYGDIPMTGNAMRFGVLEFLTKPFDGPKLRRKQESEISAIHARFDRLTRRERELHETPSIAERLHLFLSS
jgi:FixJ family two-component response regulator